MTRYQALYESEVVTVLDWHCSGEDRAGRTPEGRHGFAFVRGGAFCRRGPDGDVLAQPGAVLYFRAAGEYETQHPIDCGDHGTLIGIAGDVMDEAAWGCGLDPRRDPPLDRAPAAMPLPVLLELSALAASLQAGGRPRLEVDAAALRLLEAALAALSGHRAREPRRSDTRQAHRAAVERVKRIAAERYSEPLPLAELAREAAYSPFHLCRVFKDLEGVSIHRYVTRLRLLAALETLDAGETLARLGCRVGFCSHAHFTTAFRREFGVPPSAAARQVGRR